MYTLDSFSRKRSHNVWCYMTNQSPCNSAALVINFSYIQCCPVSDCGLCSSLACCGQLSKPRANSWPSHTVPGAPGSVVPRRSIFHHCWLLRGQKPRPLVRVKGCGGDHVSKTGYRDAGSECFFFWGGFVDFFLE